MRSRRFLWLVPVLLASACSTAPDPGATTAPTTAGSVTAVATPNQTTTPSTPAPPTVPPTPDPTVTTVTPAPDAGPTTDVSADTVRTDLAYGEALLQRLDLFLPEGDGPFPLLLWLHGGGWVVGDKVQLPYRDLVDDGIAVASANYRGALDPYPGLLEDPGLALRWLVDRADEFALDTDRVMIGGFSAGAHLAALTAFTTDVPVTGLIGFAGPYDLQDLTNVPGSGMGARGLLALMLDCPIEDCPDRLAQASPVTRVTPGAPPTFLQAGTADTVVDPRATDALARELEAAGVPVEVEVIDGFAHGVDRSDAAEAFVFSVLRP